MVWNTLNEPEGVTNVASQRVPEAAAICLVKRTQGQRPAGHSEGWVLTGDDDSQRDPSTVRVKNGVV